MPTPSLFSGSAPFPSDVRTASIPRVSLARLLQGSSDEEAILFDACRTFGFLQLDLRGPREGEALLKDAEKVLDLNQALHSLDLEEKMQHPYAPPNQLFGYVRSPLSRAFCLLNRVFVSLETDRLSFFFTLPRSFAL